MGSFYKFGARVLVAFQVQVDVSSFGRKAYVGFVICMRLSQNKGALGNPRDICCDYLCWSMPGLRLKVW